MILIGNINTHISVYLFTSWKWLESYLRVMPKKRKLIKMFLNVINYLVTLQIFNWSCLRMHEVANSEGSANNYWHTSINYFI